MSVLTYHAESAILPSSTSISNLKERRSANVPKGGTKRRGRNGKREKENGKTGKTENETRTWYDPCDMPKLIRFNSQFFQNGTEQGRCVGDQLSVISHQPCRASRASGSFSVSGVLGIGRWVLEGERWNVERRKGGRVERWKGGKGERP